MKDNNLFERRFSIRTKDSFELKNICLIKKNIFKTNRYLFK